MRAGSVASELFGVEGEANSLWSGELAPTEPEERTWTGLDMASLCAAAAWNLPMYLLASGMTMLGMSTAALLGTVLVGSVVTALLAVGCGHAGRRYGIPFAVFARIGFGVIGARVPVALRAMAGCVWLGIACWFGAESLSGLLRLVVPVLSEQSLWVCFGVMLLVAAGVPAGGDRRSFYGIWLGTLALTMAIAALWFPLWTYAGAAALPPAITVSGPDLSVSRQIALCMTGALGVWLPATMGTADLARRARSQRGQGWATIALPVAATIFSAIAMAITMVVADRGTSYWNPAVLAGSLRRPILAWPCLLGLTVAAVLAARPLGHWLGGEIAGLVPAGMTAAGGRWIACGLAVICAPRWWLNDPLRYIGGWLTGCAGLLAPVAAILLMEYFVLLRRWLNVDDLYQRDGLYEYSDGWNGRAFGALAAGWVVMGFVIAAPSFAGWRGGAVWIGTGVSAAVYWVLRSGPPDVAQIPPTPLLIPLAGFESEGASG